MRLSFKVKTKNDLEFIAGEPTVPLWGISNVMITKEGIAINYTNGHSSFIKVEKHGFTFNELELLISNDDYDKI